MRHAPSCLIALATVAAVLSGCASTQSIQPVSLASPEGRAEVNARAQRSSAVLTVDGEPGRLARQLRLGPDTTTWTDEDGTARSVATADVTGVMFRRSGTGALKGMAVGVAMGAALGLAAGSNQRGFVQFSPWALALGGATVGVLPGLAIGAVRSERQVYRVSPAQTGESAGRPTERCGGPPLACAVTPPRRP